ncbi:hypothetical protein MINTMi27_14710 [Mycobacterium intracellulare]|uniref:recombinase family protein n=1 Tax=Mycobacterium intracellulare TaxID=1767 RepID=UPI0019291B1F|nr:recombinase family protein [Mycobacterium intracellulare]BCP41378.1 hypothetical protein MINTMi27_14710 [Mycobacterium intracellulare]
MHELYKLKAVIYVRKSTVSDGKSTRDQESECRNWCATNKIPVEKVFKDEGKGASRHSKKERDSWAELKAYLRSGHILVAWEASRATRDTAEGAALLNLCEERGIPLAYNGRILDPSTGDDRFLGGLDFLLAARESDIIRERVNRGLRGAAADGTPHGKVPWGYRAKPRKVGERPEWEFDPIEAPRVREAVERIMAGESYKSVYRWLRSTGHAPPNPSCLSRLLCSPTMTGKRIFQGKVVGKGTWPALITEEQHQFMVSRRENGYHPPGPESRHLCSGITFCARCNSPMRYRTREGRKPTYVCRTGCVSRPADVLDKYVEDAVLRRLANINPDDYDSSNPEIAEAERRIEELEANLAEWEEKAINEQVSPAVFAKIEKDRRQKIAALRPHTVPQEQIEFLRPENWDAAPMKVKRDHVRVLLKVTIPMTDKRRRLSEDEIADITPI